MIGIYENSFIDYLRDILGDPVKINNKNIITRCPWCEYKLVDKHYHLYISTEIPIFHCFHGGCNQSGTMSKLLKKLSGKDLSEKFINHKMLKEIKEKEINIPVSNEKGKIILPDLKEDFFKIKSIYLKSRLKFSKQDLSSIKGLIFDINEFISINKIVLDDKLKKIKDYLHSNFIGFLTENESLVILRNVDHNSDFRYFKLFVSSTKFLDYYKLYGQNYLSNKIVIAEGIFDIFNEHIFDYTGLRNNTKLYAAGLSTSFDSLIKSIVINEMIFRLDVSILADRGIPKEYFQKIKKYNTHIIDRMTVFYNKSGKDFGDSQVIPEKFIL